LELKSEATAGAGIKLGEDDEVGLYVANKGSPPSTYLIIIEQQKQ
jgi:hypothetical protein